MKLLLTSIASNIIERALPLLPKSPAECKIICIPTAANGEEGEKEWLTNELNGLRAAGLTLTLFELEGKNESEVAAAIEDADIVYLSGGNTFYLLEKMRACNFEKVIRKFLDRGGLYIGSSASTITCCPDIAYARSADNPDAASLTDTCGLNLVNCYITVHMNQEFFAEKFKSGIEALSAQSLPVICLNDDQAIFVDGESIYLI